LVGGGIGIIGILLGIILGHWLEQSSKKKQEFEVANPCLEHSGG